MSKLTKYIKKYWRYKFCLRRKGVKVKLTANVSKRCEFEGLCKIYDHVEFEGHIGYGSYIAAGSVLSAHIGRFTSIGPNVRSAYGRHPFTLPYVSTSPMFFSLRKQTGGTFATSQCFDELHSANNVPGGPLVHIGNDCWVGLGVTLVDGITIGDGAMILAGAVVTKDIPPYAIAGGIPARIIGYRYDEETIALLLKTQWWNQDEAWFKENWQLLNDMEAFKKAFSSKS